MVEAVFESSEALTDGGVGDFELRGRDAAVVVLEAQAVVAPDEGGAAGAAASGDAWAAFARFAALAGFGGEPVEGMWGGGEGAVGGGEEGADGCVEDWESFQLVVRR